MKRWLKVSLIIIGILILVSGSFIALLFKMIGDGEKAYDGIMPINLQSVSDGVYRGRAGEFIVTAELDVTVTGHRITGVEIIRQFCGSKYKALDIIPRMLDEQSVKVDVVSGATQSSRTIMTAAYKALGGK